MVHFKSTSVLALLSILSVSAKCAAKNDNNDRAVATEVKCNTLFGRTVAGEGKNNYSFSCKCTASNYNVSLDNQCSYSGETPKSFCSASDVRTPDNQLIFNIVNCTSNSVLVNIKAKTENKRASFPLQCENIGTSGLQCKGSTTVL